MSKAAMRREKEYEKLGKQLHLVYATGENGDTVSLSKCKVCLKRNCLVKRKVCNECRADWAHRDRLKEFEHLLKEG